MADSHISASGYVAESLVLSLGGWLARGCARVPVGASTCSSTRACAAMCVRHTTHYAGTTSHCHLRWLFGCIIAVDSSKQVLVGERWVLFSADAVGQWNAVHIDWFQYNGRSAWRCA